MENETTPQQIPLTTEELLQKYIESFTEKERMAYLIAKEHLTMSFNLEKSNGYLKWKAKHGHK